MAGEPIYNLLTGTQEVSLDIGPGTYDIHNNSRTSIGSWGFALVNHTGIKKGDTIWLSAHISIHGVSDYMRAGVEPSFDGYFGIWMNNVKEYDGVMVISHTAKNDIPDGTSVGQNGIYFQYDKPVTISEGGYVRIDHVMMNVGDAPAAWAPAEGEALSIGGGQE